MDKKPTARQQQLEKLADRVAGYPELDRLAWMANKPEQFAAIMRPLIAKAQRRQAEEWARKVAAFEPHVLALYLHALTNNAPKRAAELLPLVDLYRFAAAVTLQPIPTPQNQPTNTGNHHATAI